MRGQRLAGLVAAVLALLPLAAAADDKDDALKLAQRVASRGGYVDAVVTLHAPPADLPATVPLPRATLLGSVVEKVRQSGWTSVGRTLGTATFYVATPTMLYYDAPAGREAAIAAYESALQKAGWKPAPDIRRRLPLPQGGFQMNPFSNVRQWCAPDAKTGVAITNGSDSTSFDLTLASSGANVNLQCSDSTSPLDEFAQRSPLPTFSAPSGIAITASGPASDGSTTGARLESKLGLPAVFDAFAKQLRDAGWAAGPSTSAATTRTQTFTKTVDGTPYVTLLAVYALDATHYVALADVSNSAP